ncbi:PadR family transcriptional regulator [Enterococcus saigonensis]|uniref:PadR family transcriptional regulator n=1 Tax=Enterococcus saigonensis TaxID=1805431 RepID=A0A679IFB9_9ENTE|nr:helix-turn-helix transcriptional regulator [Enterococcus saigonensis]BCA87020.1 PadR family transcriptional regulator [Enterococcus saigonensis]
MKTDQLPLTETIFYLLLVFSEPTYGYLAIKKIEALSLGNVRIAAGTMYGAIENLLKANMIVQVSPPEERRKIYHITDYGRKILTDEVNRMKHCTRLFEEMEER